LALAPLQRICTVVAARHRVWRDAQLNQWLDDNIFEQPENRGTAHGVLFALLQVMVRDPNATILLLPADHHVLDEAAFEQELRRAADLAALNAGDAFLLGVEPDDLDADFGYIVPQQRHPRDPSRVAEFVEKPALPEARELLARGALWNTFVIASSARTLLSLYGREFDGTIIRMLNAVEHTDSFAMKAVYRTLATLDFCRDVLEGQESCLQLVPVAPCGWTDLGTPARVAQALAKQPCPAGATGLISEATQGLDLAAQHWRKEFSRNPLPG
jgi:mannose-1-phosphate guanylyltransferase